MPEDKNAVSPKASIDKNLRKGIALFRGAMEDFTITAIAHLGN
jgi:hypothetical protein